MTIENGERRKPAGRSGRFGRGRINTTVRFTDERYAELKAAADAAGRSLSEQVEFELEDYRRAEMVRDKYERQAAEIAASVDRLAVRYEAMMDWVDGLLKLQNELQNERAAAGEKVIAEAQRITDRLEKVRDADNERIAETVAIALVKTLGRSQQ
jgi:hypothetical protein